MSLLFQLPCVRRIMSLRNQHVLIQALLLAIVFFMIVLNMSSDQVFSTDNTITLDSKQSNIGGWKHRPFEDWTFQEIMDYIQWTNSSSCNRANHFGGGVVFTVGIDGQKAVCLDPPVAPVKSYGGWPVTVTNKSSECLVYSFGINNEWSFDEAMQDFGCRVYAFDPSMNMTNHNHSTKIHFYNLGLGDRDETLPVKSPDAKDWKMMSLDSIYYGLLHHGSRVIDYLKIDIESGEWRALPQIMASGMLNRVRQLGIEIHLIPERETQLKVIRKRVELIKKLEDVYGFVRFNSIYSPWSNAWKIVDDNEWLGYNSYELAWYNSKLSRSSTEQ